ncbi:MAG: glutamine-hydrolyzing carbamoyl-phosphate synthase small subunit [Armatimonadetes bacterium]|nr:glutamine-hydrolyzing carbamoyl-phosphate synthase small subunit [Armatimonadota bacterium]
MPALLALEDGTVFRGWNFGAKGERSGEVVFNTGMTGYQEVLTDPSYRGQIVTMTYTEIGNYGITADDSESWRPWVEGFVVREFNGYYSNWRATESLGEFLERHGIVGIEGVDTRKLTKHIRTVGAQIGIITTETLDPGEAVDKARAAPRLVGRDLVSEVTCREPKEWLGEDFGREPGRSARSADIGPVRAVFHERPHVVVVDCGVKYNILRHLHRRGARLTVVPAFYTAEQILDLNPQGVVLSNGPGDPEAVTGVIKLARELIGRLPILGICLGHQMLALALGGRTYKLKFGHRGVNHPVKYLPTGAVEITTQNHGFCVDMDSLSGTGMELTHVNLNDGSCEGMRHRELPIFSVQFHPEAGPGPHDAVHIFDEFLSALRSEAARA